MTYQDASKLYRYYESMIKALGPCLGVSKRSGSLSYYKKAVEIYDRAKEVQRDLLQEFGPNVMKGDDDEKKSPSPSLAIVSDGRVRKRKGTRDPKV